MNCEQSQTAAAQAGAAIYTKWLLSVYDLAVIKMSNQLDAPASDSIALNYVLHCLPGTMRSKHMVFDNLNRGSTPTALCLVQRSWARVYARMPLRGS